jgi:hypothetical protein
MTCFTTYTWTDSSGNEFDFEITGNAVKGYPDTRDCPGEPSHVEDREVKLEVGPVQWADVAIKRIESDFEKFLANNPRVWHGIQDDMLRDADARCEPPEER